jgi:hypothetical protein
MLKYLVFFVFLVGCGQPPTPDEVKAENLVSQFAADCKNVYGDRCDIPIVVHSLSEAADDQTCWFEDGNPVRQLVLHRKMVVQNNKEAIYEFLFMCSLNLGTLEKNLLKFEEFALVLGFSQINE